MRAVLVCQKFIIVAISPKMNKPIKRIWVPPQAPAKALQAVPSVSGLPTAPVAAVNEPLQATPVRRNMLFEELPEPEMVEKDSDSIWAEFDSIPGLIHPAK
jgi:hypothetical protein